MLLAGAGVVLFPKPSLARTIGWTRCSDGSWVRTRTCLTSTTVAGPTPTTSTTPTPSPTPTTSTVSTTSTTTTATTLSTTSTATGYQPSLVNGYTPNHPTWHGHTWAADMGSTWNPNMPYCWEYTSTKARFELHNTSKDKGDNDPSTKRRSELHANKDRLPNGVEMWGAYSFLDHAWSDPAGMKAIGSGGAHSQMHMPSGGSPAFAFRRYKDGRFLVTTNGDNDPTSNHKRYIGTLSFGQVHDVVYRFTLHPTHGALDVWLDGRHIVSLWDSSIGSSEVGCYQCYGLYYGRGVTCSVVTEIGNIAFPSRTSLSSRITSRPRW